MLIKNTFHENEWTIMCVCACVWASLVGQYSIDLSDDCWQLSQAEHRGHHPMIVTNLYTNGQWWNRDILQKDTAHSTVIFHFNVIYSIQLCVCMCVYLPGLTPAVWPGRSRRLRLVAGRCSHAPVSVPVATAPPSSGRWPPSLHRAHASQRTASAIANQERELQRLLNKSWAIILLIVYWFLAPSQCDDIILIHTHGAYFIALNNEFMRFSFYLPYHEW